MCLRAAGTGHAALLRPTHAMTSYEPKNRLASPPVANVLVGDPSLSTLVSPRADSTALGLAAPMDPGADAGMRPDARSASLLSSEANGRQSARKSLVFIGFMATGKSSIAQSVAGELGTSALDVDRLIEDRIGEPIDDFFRKRGEATFRELEEELTLSALDSGGVVALGGGAVESPRIRRALGEHHCVWCSAEEETSWTRAANTGRPLADDRDEFRRRYAMRLPLYRELASSVVPTDGDRSRSGLAAWLRKTADHEDARLIWASASSGDYPVVIGPGVLSLHEQDKHAWFVVADSNVLRLHRKLLPDWLANKQRTIEVADGESGKTMQGAEEILTEFVRRDALREDGVFAFGGGVVGDLAGFCAALYHRGGMSVVQAPTTLLSQVDSAYGGKTGVNLPIAKHQVGAFLMPKAVLADTRTLQTLPPAELSSGFVEVIKTALIAGGALWNRVRSVDSIGEPGLEQIIFDCARTKLDIVASDEHEHGRRAWLNLGHTIGHAIEVATCYQRYRHGEAIGLGLLAVLQLSGAPDLRDEIEVMLRHHGLPTRLEGTETEAVFRAVGRDKKKTSKGIGFVLLSSPGEPQEGQIVAPSEIRSAIDALKATA